MIQSKGKTKTKTEIKKRPQTATKKKEEKSLKKQEAAPQPSYSDPVLERTFRGHKDTITSVGFNPNLY